MKYTLILIIMIIVAGGCNRQPQSVKLPKKTDETSLLQTVKTKTTTEINDITNLKTVPTKQLSSDNLVSKQSDFSIIRTDSPLPKSHLIKAKNYSLDSTLSGKFSRIKKEVKAPRPKQYNKENIIFLKSPKTRKKIKN